MKVADLQMRAGLYSLKTENINPKKDIHQSGSAEQAEGINFADILNQRIEESNTVKVSAHAVKRLEERSLMVSANEIERLNNGVKQVDAKGSKNSLILVDDTAFVVSVKNKTVITAIDKQMTVNNVFTNIDSVAIV